MTLQRSCYEGAAAAPPLTILLRPGFTKCDTTACILYFAVVVSCVVSLSHDEQAARAIEFSLDREPGSPTRQRLGQRVHVYILRTGVPP